MSRQRVSEFLNNLWTCNKASDIAGNYVKKLSTLLLNSAKSYSLLDQLLCEQSNILPSSFNHYDNIDY